MPGILPSRLVMGPYQELSILPTRSPSGGKFVQCPGDPCLQHTRSEPGEYQGPGHSGANWKKEWMSEALLLPPPQILVETERGMVSMRLPSAESVDQVTRHVSSALSKVCPGPG